MENNKSVFFVIVIIMIAFILFINTMIQGVILPIFTFNNNSILNTNGENTNIVGFNVASIIKNIGEKNFGGINTSVVIGIIFIAFLLIYIIATYNKLVNLKQKVKQSVSGIDVYLKQRFDLIPNIVETVKMYASYEKDVLETITEIRNNYSSVKEGNIEDLAKINNRYTKILAIVENYPELKANEGFLQLQKALSKIESQLQAARRIYNSEVTGYNIIVMSFPSNLIAKIFRFGLEKLFEIEIYEKNNIDAKI